MLELPYWKVQAQENIFFFFSPTTIKFYQKPEQPANKHLLRPVANLKAQDGKKETCDTFLLNNLELI